MPKICYEPKPFKDATRKIIDQANAILEEYAREGYNVPTLRSLYYQFVARGYLANDQKEYKRLGVIIGEGRLAGLIDWEHLEDRTRYLDEALHLNSVQGALDWLPEQFHVDMWANQEWRPEVWIEKDAVAGLVMNACRANDVPFFSCRGYSSLSEMWRASLRLRYNIEQGYKPYIIHFGDHDPSGKDMSRDIVDRLNKTFMADCEFVRVALNMDQIEKYKPPPNPAKIKDPRAKTYIKEFGRVSWELDALSPRLFTSIINEQVEALRDKEQWKADEEAREKARERLKEVARDWNKPKTTKKVKKKAATKKAVKKPKRKGK